MNKISINLEGILKKILFIRSENAFLPEIDAYIEFFNKTNEYIAYDTSKLELYDLNDYDVIWEFKGFRGIKKIKNQILIHEYASLSTGKFPKLKNILKRIMNPKPDIRIFLNEDVKNGFGFNDNIPFCYRDMGISEEFLKYKNQNKEYDLIYLGAISKSRGMDKCLESLEKSNFKKMCFVGNFDDDLYNKYKDNSRFIFTGKVPYSEVPKIASKAIYGLNYMPDVYPFNLQTSTKLLDYLALDLKIITTDYKWIREFEQKNNCKFYKISEEEFSLDGINKFEFINNFITKEYLWNKIIEKSNLLRKL